MSLFADMASAPRSASFGTGLVSPTEGSLGLALGIGFDVRGVTHVFHVESSES